MLIAPDSGDPGQFIIQKAHGVFGKDSGDIFNPMIISGIGTI